MVWQTTRSPLGRTCSTKDVFTLLSVVWLRRPTNYRAIRDARGELRIRPGPLTDTGAGYEAQRSALACQHGDGMNPPATTDTAAQAALLQQWLTRARREGEEDVFSGKREWKRFDYKFPVEIVLENGRSAEPLYAETHTVSAGGASIWCRSGIDVLSHVRICEWPSDQATGWLTGRVVYCDSGLRGYMIGIVWDHPLESEARSGSRSVDAACPTASPAVTSVAEQVSREPIAETRRAVQPERREAQPLLTIGLLVVIVLIIGWLALG
jgi:hypothetical protein